MKTTTRQIILNLLRERRTWQPVWKLVNTNTECGFLPVAARSRAQELAQEGLVDRRYGSKDNALVPGKYSWYRIKQVPPPAPAVQVLKPEARLQALKLTPTSFGGT